MTLEVGGIMGVGAVMGTRDSDPLIPAGGAKGMRSTCSTDAVGAGGRGATKSNPAWAVGAIKHKKPKVNKGNERRMAGTR